MLQPGDEAPPFSLTGSGGSALSLAAFAGRKLVLYFYPKDDTSGCTLQAREFSALRDRFLACGTEILGVERTTFLVDASGRIARIWPKVKVPGHAEEVLAAACAL